MNRTAGNLSKLSAAVIFCLGAAGCVSKTNVSVQQPAKSPQAAAIRRVAVLPFTGPSGNEATIKFESMLTEVTHDGRPYFTVMDRRTLQNAMAELKLQQTGLVDNKSIARLGKFVGVSGIYAGTVEVLPAVDKKHLERRSECADRKCKSMREYSVTCTERLVQYTLSPRLVEVESGQVIYQRSIAKAERSDFCDEHLEDSSEVLMGRALAGAFGEVRKDIAPYATAQTLPLKSSTDGLTGDVKTRFSDALAFAEDGRMDRACDQWSALADQTGPTLAISYNLAVCDEASGRLQQALDRYTAIDSGLSRPDSDVNAALVRVRARMADEVALQAQIRPTSAASFVPAAGPAAGTKIPKGSRADR